MGSCFGAHIHQTNNANSVYDVTRRCYRAVNTSTSRSFVARRTCPTSVNQTISKQNRRSGQNSRQVQRSCLAGPRAQEVRAPPGEGVSANRRVQKQGGSLPHRGQEGPSSSTRYGLTNTPKKTTKNNNSDLRCVSVQIFVLYPIDAGDLIT